MSRYAFRRAWTAETANATSDSVAALSGRRLAASAPNLARRRRGGRMDWFDTHLLMPPGRAGSAVATCAVGGAAAPAVPCGCAPVGGTRAADGVCDR